jgi:type IV pilus assembly protein PilB
VLNSEKQMEETSQNQIVAASPAGSGGDSALQERAKALGVLFLAEVPQKINKRHLGLIPQETAERYRMAIFSREGSLVKVAMINPQDIQALNALRFITEKEGAETELYLVSEEVFEKIFSQYSTAEKAVEAAFKSLQNEELGGFETISEKDEEKKIEKVIQDAPIAKLVEVVLKHAIEGRASDIHIEPIEKEFRVRFRVDGILHSSLTLPKEVGRAVVSRVKILSNLKIDEKRKPQDGRFQIVDNGNAIDFRVSTLPVVDGEKVVMRILDKESKPLDFEALGLWGRNLEILRERIKDPYGIILISGPTGSGKSTTLYAFLTILNQEERNIITLEDPVEYFVEGVNQSQIKPEIGYTFSNGLRSILRQDPNVIMVGEIRDTETAELAIHASLTGHLILSTVHTNDSIGAIPRLIDMGVEPFLLASSLRVVAAQRLARRICEVCKEPVAVPESVKKMVLEEIKEIPVEELAKYGVDLSGEPIFYQGRGKGCEKCGETGYKGRIAIYEALEIDRRIQEIISEKRECETDIRDEAARRKMITIRQDGLLKVLKGITTISEIERLTEGKMTVGGDLDDDKG